MSLLHFPLGADPTSLVAGQPRQPVRYDGIAIFYHLLRADEPQKIHFVCLTYIPALADMEEEMRQKIEAAHGASSRLIESEYQILGWVVSDPRLEIQIFEGEIEPLKAEVGE